MEGLIFECQKYSNIQVGLQIQASCWFGGGSGLPMFTADQRGIGDESPLSELFAFCTIPVAVLSSILPSTRVF